jgi:hypothetical protein
LFYYLLILSNLWDIEKDFNREVALFSHSSLIVLA